MGRPPHSGQPDARELPEDSSRLGIELIPTRTAESTGVRCTDTTSDGPELTNGHGARSENTEAMSTDGGKNGPEVRATSGGNTSGTTSEESTSADRLVLTPQRLNFIRPLFNKSKP